MRSGSAMLLACALLAACGGGPRAADQEVEAAGAEPPGRDPCTLVSTAEASSVLGPLAESPYRVDDDRRADPAGTGCLYRAKDGRHVQLYVDWDEGPIAFRMLGGTGAAVTTALGGDPVGADTLEGAWDKVATSFGQLIALKGRTSVQVDPLGSRIGEVGAAKLASIALGRLDAPLDYDGAEPARRRNPPPAPGDPCSLVTRPEAEALMGPLRADPAPADDRSACRFQLVATFGGEPVVNVLEVEWTGGFYTLGQMRHSMGMAADLMSREFGGDVPQSAAGTAAAGEPWDDLQTIMGGVVMVVRRDVLLQVVGNGVGGFDEERAKELLRLAAGRL